MDALFSAYDPTLTLIISGGLIVVAMLVAVTITIRRGDHMTGLFAVIVSYLVFMIVMAVTGIIGNASDGAAEGAQREWVESHGISASDETLDALKFPDAAPETDQAFGIAQAVRDKAIISIHLTWEDGEFVLYGTDGEPLERLGD